MNIAKFDGWEETRLLLDLHLFLINKNAILYTNDVAK